VLIVGLTIATIRKRNDRKSDIDVDALQLPAKKSSPEISFPLVSIL
jgi:hypothetical protein